MLSLLFIVLAGVFVYFAFRYFQRFGKEDISAPKTSEKLKKLWNYAEKATKAGRDKTTEKALLAILKIDHKNTAAYNRLGMLYARKGNFDDAIDCFSIASSLTPTLATLYNLGLVHYEKGNYKEAANAFERVVDLEPNEKRYVAYAKALNKLENYKKVTEILEKVIELEPNIRNYEMLADAFSKSKNFDKAEDTRKKIAMLRTKKITSPASKQKSAPKLTAKRVI